MLLSVFFYVIHFAIFGDAVKTISGLMLSLAYVPLGVTYQILVLDKLFEARLKIRSTRKINMILGSFYYEVGNSILKTIAEVDENINSLQSLWVISEDWKQIDFSKLEAFVSEYRCCIDMDILQYERISDILKEQGGFLLSLVINPNLEEYEEFTNMIISILHMRDLLVNRNKNKILEDYEKYYLKHEICNLYRFLLIEWVKYMNYLRDFYPSLFIRALMNSPFDLKTNKERDLQQNDIGKDYK